MKKIIRNSLEILKEQQCVSGKSFESQKKLQIKTLSELISQLNAIDKEIHEFMSENSDIQALQGIQPKIDKIKDKLVILIPDSLSTDFNIIYFSKCMSDLNSLINTNSENLEESKKTYLPSLVYNLSLFKSLLEKEERRINNAKVFIPFTMPLITSQENKTNNTEVHDIKLPDEKWVEIFTWLDKKDIPSAASTCQFWNARINQTEYMEKMKATKGLFNAISTGNVELAKRSLEKKAMVDFKFPYEHTNLKGKLKFQDCSFLHLLVLKNDNFTNMFNTNNYIEICKLLLQYNADIFHIATFNQSFYLGSTSATRRSEAFGLCSRNNDFGLTYSRTLTVLQKITFAEIMELKSNNVNDFISRIISLDNDEEKQIVREYLDFLKSNAIGFQYKLTDSQKSAIFADQRIITLINTPRPNCSIM